MTHEELKTVEELFEQGLHDAHARVSRSKRDIAQLSGNSGRTTACDRAHGSAMIENELKLLQARNQVQTAVHSELREVQAKIPNLRDQYRAAKQAYEHMTIRAPVSGTVMASRATRSARSSARATPFWRSFPPRNA